MRLRQTVGERDDHQRAVPEVFVLVVLHQPIAHVARLADIGARQPGLGQLTHQKIHTHLLGLGHLEEVCQLTARHFDHANNVRRDLGHAHAARVTGGEGDLDGLGAYRNDRTVYHRHFAKGL